MDLENYFVKAVEECNMTKPLEILNWYRNLYYKEEAHTEHRIMADSIYDLFMEYKDVLCGDEE